MSNSNNSSTKLTVVSTSMYNLQLEDLQKEPPLQTQSPSTTLTKITSSPFWDFTRRLTAENRSATIKKWETLDIETLADSVVSELRNGSAYKTAIFAHPDIEFIALYAAIPERPADCRLTIHEASSILIYKTACDVFSRAEIKVHFLVNANHEVNESELQTFHSTINKLPGYPTWQEKIHEHFKTAKIPPHQMVYFSMPTSESDIISVANVAETLLHGFVYLNADGINRRYIHTPEMQDCFNQVPYPNNPSSSHCAIGEIAEEEFDNFYRRPLGIPFCLESCPERADDRLTMNKINFLTHDNFHVYYDRANPHLAPLQELLPIIKKMPHASIAPLYQRPGAPWVTNFPSLLEMYRDREYQVHTAKSNLSPDTRFWLSMLRTFEYYSRGLMVITHRDPLETQKIIKIAANQFVSYIEANKTKWKDKYGITLDSLSRLSSFSRDTTGQLVPLNYEQRCIIDIFNQSQESNFDII